LEGLMLLAFGVYLVAKYSHVAGHQGIRL